MQSHSASAYCWGINKSRKLKATGNSQRFRVFRLPGYSPQFSHKSHSLPLRRLHLTHYDNTCQLFHQDQPLYHGPNVSTLFSSVPWIAWQWYYSNGNMMHCSGRWIPGPIKQIDNWTIYCAAYWHSYLSVPFSIGLVLGSWTRSISWADEMYLGKIFIITQSGLWSQLGSCWTFATNTMVA